MIRKSRREIECELDDLDSKALAPDPLFVAWYEEKRSEEWIHEEWATIAREAKQCDCGPMGVAWIRALKQTETYR